MDESRARVLVVDDEEPIRRIISMTLEAGGYHCVPASNGEEALEKAADEEFDLVLLDIKMPGMSGIELLPQLTFAHPDICVVMSTAVNSTQTAVEAMNLGAYDYVLKPFDITDLRMKVERALERKRLLEENREYRLNQAREKYSALVENLAEAVIVIRQGAIAWCNERVEELLGYPTQELVGREAMSLFAEEAGVAGSWWEVEAAMEKGSRLHGTTLARKKDGTVACVGYSASRVHGEEPPEIIAVLHDAAKTVTTQGELEEQGETLPEPLEQPRARTGKHDRLQEALNEVTRLRGLLPLCARCRSIRDDDDYWNSVMAYFDEHPQTDSGWGICPDCMKGKGSHK